jgi:5-methylcytosine-specific restriction protein A
MLEPQGRGRLMPRALPEWIGANDDSPVPARVRLRVFLAADGHCAICKRKISPSTDKWTCDHIKALINGGGNRETNLQVLCEWCDKPKTVFDLKEKAATYRRRKRHYGIKRKRPSFATNRDGPFRKRVDGTVERR